MVERLTLNPHQSACELRRKLAGAILLVLLTAIPAFSQHADPTPAAPAREAHATGTTAQATQAEHGPAEEHGVFSGLIWPTINFAILCAGLYYFLREPLTTYLRDRDAAIRKDLVVAGDLRSTATAQLAEIEQRLQALPGELDALRRRGAEEIAAEEQRIAAQAAQERDRLVDQARREIDLQVRLAKRELVEHAATLAVQIATERVQQDITPADHQRLTERYLDQIEKGRAH